jgi:hypothetical protein
VSAVELVSDGIELALLELGDPDATPAFGSTNEGGVHQLQDGTFAEGMGNDLAAPAFFAEQPLE